MADTQRQEVDVSNCKKLVVYIQGDLTKMDQKAVFVTVHDLGSNHTSWVQFLEHPVMKETRERSIFIHVVVPGQDDNAPDLASETFPTMQQIADDLPTVLDKLGVKLAIGLGEGAGANILVRFGIANPSRCMGLVLIHCTAEQAGMMEHFKDKFINWKTTGVASSAEQYLIMHKFGNQIKEQLDTAENQERLIKEYKDRLQSGINPKNLRKYVEAYLKRSDFTPKLEKLSVETLMVAGSKAAHIKGVHNMHQASNKAKASLLKIDDVGDVLSESPDKMAQSLLLFCKGLGVLTSVPLAGVDRQRTFSGSSQGSSGGRGGLTRQRTMSMEEYDTPNLRRFSFSAMQQTN